MVDLGIQLVALRLPDTLSEEVIGVSKLASFRGWFRVKRERVLRNFVLHGKWHDVAGKLPAQ
ncbi:MAG: hypothetical protein WKF37_22295, partial [Bryobacteraceae bacterium]